ncbi:MAG: hypothetical protein ACYS8W_08380 [Planctomycetota bacterium]
MANPYLESGFDFKQKLTPDLHLRSYSQCIDAGDPDPSYNDRNASRNDMGAYGGPCEE